VTQELVRNRLIKYIEDNGARMTFISRAVDTPDYIMSKFKTAKIELWEDNLTRVHEFLEERNY